MRSGGRHPHVRVRGMAYAGAGTHGDALQLAGLYVEHGLARETNTVVLSGMGSSSPLLVAADLLGALQHGHGVQHRHLRQGELVQRRIDVPAVEARHTAGLVFGYNTGLVEGMMGEVLERGDLEALVVVHGEVRRVRGVPRGPEHEREGEGVRGANTLHARGRGRGGDLRGNKEMRVGERGKRRGYSRIGTRVTSSFPSDAPSAPASSRSGAYEANQALSLGAMVRSRAKSTSTRVSSCAAYVAFRVTGASLLIEVRKRFRRGTLGAAHNRGAHSL